MPFQLAVSVAVAAMLAVAGCAGDQSPLRPQQEAQFKSSEQKKSSSRPNVILIIADDLGLGDVRAFNSAGYFATPNIDRLARDGAMLTQAYVTAAVCSPSRAGLHSGVYQARFGHDFNPRQQETPPFSLPLTQPTVAEGMKKAGYRTALVGKWHLGRDVGYDPISRGFDEYFGYGPGALYIDDPQPGDSLLPLPGQPENADRDRERRRYFIRGRERIQDDAYLTDVVTRESLAFIDREKDNPFYLVVAQHAPHVPIEATKTYMDRVASIADNERRTYAAMITALDDGVGAILDRLEKHGIADNTVVMFLSDNGCPDYISELCSNTALAGHKREFREGGIRTPMFIKYPGVTKPGQRLDSPVISLDLSATTLAIGGATATARDGRDLAPFLSGAASGAVHDRLYWRAGPVHAIREGDWKFVSAPKPGGGTATFLFNLKSDPGETRDLKSNNPEVAARLAKAYDAWNKGNVDPRWDGRTVTKEFAGTPVEVKF